ncbi:MAG: heavy metal translocating P-type ATPase [Syntrophobacteraceae bacterium]
MYDRNGGTSSSISEAAREERRPGAGACSLCGLPADSSPFEYAAGGAVHRFCCPGCLNVFQILYNSPDGPPENYRETELYKACLASGLIARGAAPPPRDGTARRPDPARTLAAEEYEGLSKDLTVRIGGMWCTACSWLIEETLRKTAGVLDVRVAFLNDLALVRYLPHRVSPARILERISKLGYGASSSHDPLRESQEKRDLFLRLGISFILTMNIMMISFALYFGFIEELGEGAVRLFSYPLWILATPVVFYGGYPILRRAFYGLANRSLPMDVLIAFGSLSAYGYSVFMLAGGSIHLYFDTAAMLVVLVLLGRYIEMQAREKVSRGIDELCRLAGAKVRLPSETGERWIAAEALRPGDEFLTRAGDGIPVDARVVRGSAAVDESAVTGEARPVKKVEGDDVTGGSLLLDGELRLSAVRVGPDAFLNRMIALMREAVAGKNPTEHFADRVTRRLVPSVLLLAAGTALVLLLGGAPGEDAMLRALSVLVITCPCALGIAVPLAKVNAVSIGRANGILFRDPTALEKIGKLDTLVFDKTGTLTEGNFSLRSVVLREDPPTAAAVPLEDTGTPGAGPPESVFPCPERTGRVQKALRRVAAIESRSEHFLAKAIVRKAGELRIPFEEATDFASFDGSGVEGTSPSGRTSVGSRPFMAARGLDLSPELDRSARSREAEGATVVFFGWDRHTRGFFEFGDTIRPGSKAVVAALLSRGIDLWLVSGDSRETTGSVARELGIGRWAGQTLPGEKAAVVRRLQGEGRRVGMVGDGINDAAALAQADVGFAAGSGQNIAREASDVALLTDDPEGMLRAFSLATLTARTVRQNLFFAFFYNALAVPLAVSGLLNPLWAAFAMFAGSLTVTGNTLRISRLFRSRRRNSPC